MSVTAEQYQAFVKGMVDEGYSLAEAFLQAFAYQGLDNHPAYSQQTIHRVLNCFAAQDLQAGTDYFFADGSRLNVDPYYGSMIATKVSQAVPKQAVDKQKRRR